MSSLPSPTPPVFVLGVHRSGTTWLTQALATRGQLAPYTVRHLLSAVEEHPHTPESTARRLRQAQVTERPGDGLPVVADASEEYGYLLALRHGSSRTTRRSLPVLRAAIDRLHTEQPGHVPLLRNPWDYAATHKLAEWFPGARFVFVHRDPVATVGSAVEMFRDFWTRPHPYGTLMSPRYRRAWASWWQRPLFRAACARPGLLARIVASGTALAHRAHLADAKRLPEHQQVHVHYADLLTDPTTRVDQLLHQLGVPIVGPPPPAAKARHPPERPWMAAIAPQLLRKTHQYRTVRALTPPAD